MGSLEVELARVNEIGRDLSAEIVLQEEKSHTAQIVVREGYRDGVFFEEYGSDPLGGQIIDQERIAEPDTQKREVARQQLQQIYDSSEFCSVKHIVGEVLGIREAQLENQINEWLKVLENLEIQKAYDSPVYHDLRQIYRIAPTRELRVKAGEIIGFSELSILADELRRSCEKTSLTKEELERFYVGDARELIEKAGGLLGYNKIEILCHELYSDRLFPPLTKDELKKIYTEGKLKSCREIAGLRLGYSSLRIWLHELFRKK